MYNKARTDTLFFALAIIASLVLIVLACGSIVVLMMSMSSVSAAMPALLISLAILLIGLWLLVASIRRLGT